MATNQDSETLRSEAQQRREQMEMGPGSVYELMTRQMVETLTGDVREIRQRLDGLFWMIGGAVALELIMRVVSLTN